ncbi:hypothetical protein P7K49_005952 [Saguinus oedipus]|uniref:Uncharacterized protein n=1 Tax=Saguinus oedipus TaxID=9490 RepID=A0ABQ9W1T3_SAGOE|nr:hypothetical protein P7K49_005952 [Saguinus oedipus]
MGQRCARGMEGDTGEGMGLAGAALSSRLCCELPFSKQRQLGVEEFTFVGRHLGDGHCLIRRGQASRAPEATGSGMDVRGKGRGLSGSEATSD